ALRPASQKSDTILRSVITGGDEENKSNNSLTKLCKKIDTIIPANTDNGNIHISKSLKIDNKIQPSSEICPEVSDTEISRVEDLLQCNKDSTISPNETYSQISMDEAEAIPAVVESKTHYSAIGALGLPLIALLLLALLIIVTVWITFIGLCLLVNNHSKPDIKKKEQIVYTLR
ncbi:34203_t:CDS:1, partial [Gigaspora margarita]